MNKDITILFDKLYNSGTEEEVIINLKRIVKGFTVSKYKDEIMSNPYFKILIKEIKGDILFEINQVKDNIELEIKTIDEGLNVPITISDFNKLKDLRRECVSLLYEINNKINELILL